MSLIATLGLLISTAAAAPVEVQDSSGGIAIFPDLQSAISFAPDGATLTLTAGDHGDITIDGGAHVRILAAEGAAVDSLTIDGADTVAEIAGLSMSGIDRAIDVKGGTLVLSQSELRELGSPTGYAMRVAPGATAGLVGVGVFDSQGDSGVILAEEGANLGIVNTYFEGNASNMGGAIFGAGATIGIRDAAFHNNAAADAGGAIAIVGGSLELTTVEIETSEAERGAAVYLGPDATMTATDIDLHDNTATTGGHILAEHAAANITRAKLQTGWAEHGGGIAIVDSYVVVTNAMVVANRAPQTGGAFHLDGGELELSYITMAGNQAAIGAGLAAEKGRASMAASIVSDNEGEAIANAGGQVELTWSLIDGMSRGGALAGAVLTDLTVIDGEPGFLDARGRDFALTLDSDALDAGYAGQADPDGTPSDWGMYGGEQAWELYDLDGDGFVHGRDCDDNDRKVHELGKDVWYDGIDSNCDGADDFDQDGDGEQALQFGGTDCVDTDADIRSGATEQAGDKIDANCDGMADPDEDGDGWPSSIDCDDNDAQANPGAEDRYYDGRDDDCDGRSDYDADGDGYDSARHGGTDCDDTDAFISPATPEIAADGIDQDCDGEDAPAATQPESDAVAGVTEGETGAEAPAFETPPARAATTTGCASTGAAPVGGLLGLVAALGAMFARRRDD
jgi:hypothetical protein